MPRKSFIFILFLAPLTSFAAGLDTSNTWQKSVPFYRTQESTFASGEATLQDLEKKIIESSWDLRFEVKWNHKNYLLQEKQLGFDLQYAKKALITRDFRFQGQQIQQGTKVEIQKFEGIWTLVKTGDKILWVPTQFLDASPDDVGVYKTVREITLHKDPDFKSQRLGIIPPSTEFVITQWKNEWLQVKWKKELGFIHCQDLLGRADFAHWAFIQGRGWTEIKFRTGSELLTTTGENISLSLVRGFKPYATRAFVIQPGDNTPPLKSIVEVDNRRADRWNMSLNEEHGAVWWKVPKQNSQPVGEELTFDELVKRRIYSFDYQTSPQVRGLISADGIYQSQDGKVWKKISQFDKQNHPVAIQKGVFYVGSFKSYDNGKTFEPYIQWEKLFSTLQETLHRQPPVLRLVDIKPKHDGIEIRVDTGVRPVLLKSFGSLQTWTIIQ